jgi:hypothetical protein
MLVFPHANWAEDNAAGLVERAGAVRSDRQVWNVGTPIESLADGHKFSSVNGVCGALTGETEAVGDTLC